VDEILPQLLLGIKDTNDLLVTKTLLCLADLIPILGASLVIGKNRRKLFADGRPQQTEIWSNDQPRSITPVMNESMDILLSSSPVDNVDISDYSAKIVVNGILPESLYRDENDGDLTENEGDNEWGWNQDTTNEEDLTPIDIEPVTIIEEKSLVSTSPIKEKVKSTPRPKVSDNIDELDIKNQKLTKLEEKQNEVDFFSDFGMAPTFQKTPAVVEETETPKVETSRLQMTMEPTGATRRFYNGSFSSSFSWLLSFIS
jgi:SCY1-like protein 3